MDFEISKIVNGVNEGIFFFSVMLKERLRKKKKEKLNRSGAEEMEAWRMVHFSSRWRN